MYILYCYGCYFYLSLVLIRMFSQCIAPGYSLAVGCHDHSTPQIHDNGLLNHIAENNQPNLLEICKEKKSRKFIPLLSKIHYINYSTTAYVMYHNHVWENILMGSSPMHQLCSGILYTKEHVYSCYFWTVLFNSFILIRIFIL